MPARIVAAPQVSTSNAIEHITAPRKRIEALVAEKTTPANRSEEEIAGYRTVLDTIHASAAHIPFKPSVVEQLHRDLYQFTNVPAGRWKTVENAIEEGRPDHRAPLQGFVRPEPMNTGDRAEGRCGRQAWRRAPSVLIVCRLAVGHNPRRCTSAGWRTTSFQRDGSCSLFAGAHRHVRVVAVRPRRVVAVSVFARGRGPVSATSHRRRGGWRVSMPVSGLKERVGEELFVSDWIVVRLEQELAFQAATLLTKEDLGFEPGGEDPYGPELVSGFLLLSLLVHFHKKHGVSPAEGFYGLNYGTDRVRFLAPVMAGQRVRCRARLRSLEARADGTWRVVTENTLELEGSQRPAMVADWITYHAPVPAPGAIAP